ERMPHEIPYGMSIEGLGLRGLAAPMAAPAAYQTAVVTRGATFDGDLCEIMPRSAAMPLGPPSGFGGRASPTPPSLPARPRLTRGAPAPAKPPQAPGAPPPPAFESPAKHSDEKGGPGPIARAFDAVRR